MNLPNIIAGAVCTLLRPLMRVLLRYNISYTTFADLAKWVYVRVAMEEFQLPGRKQTVSRVALLTGLSRKEVLRVKRLAMPGDPAITEKQSRAARVVSGWVRDPRFHDAENKPALLTLDGEGMTFSALAKAFSGDIPPRAVLDELIRTGVVERLEDERVRLLAPAYVPRTGKAEKLDILGTDVADLIATIDHNLDPNGGEPFFQRKVCYESFPAEHLPLLRRLTAERCQALLEELDMWMSKHDQESAEEQATAEHRRTGIAVYYFEGPVKEDRHGSDT
ncbi:MAG: hypothetical protein FD174_350 [Geobacteraceae bacterium]|nr:MAG: hypothetical protein FD174_350 [Geobacteraceae bacterium]